MGGEKNMFFEIINNEKRTVFTTDDKKCIPMIGILKLQNKNGYKFKLDGKNISLNNLINYVNEEE